MKSFAVVLLALALTGPVGSGLAHAQGAWAGGGLPRLAGERSLLLADRGERMNREQREQLREQLRSADRQLYRSERRRERRARGLREREPRWRLSPAQREALRRDIMDANRRFRRR